MLEGQNEYENQMRASWPRSLLAQGAMATQAPQGEMGYQRRMAGYRHLKT
jgi:hypothetical protein